MVFPFFNWGNWRKSRIFAFPEYNNQHLSRYNRAWKVFETEDAFIPVIWKFQSLHQENKQTNNNDNKNCFYFFWHKKILVLEEYWRILHTWLILIKRKKRKNGGENKRNIGEKVVSSKAIFLNGYVLFSLEKSITCLWLELRWAWLLTFMHVTCPFPTFCCIS